MLVKGTETIGYFGEVSSAELMTYTAFKAALSASLAGTDLADKGWFKFMYNRKVLFISKGCIASGLSWQQIYQAGGIYGFDGTGAYPSGTATNQYKPVTVTGSRTWSLIPRSLKVSNNDPSAVSFIENNGNEYSDLLYRVSIFNPSVPGSGSFANYTLAEIDLNRAEFGYNTATPTTRMVLRGGAQSNGTGTPTANYTSLLKTDASSYAQRWRGVLEVEGDPITG
jgi:hypothetical protein